MDIQEIINYSKNKIESDDLTKQVRRRIEETTWEKQNQREGFSETFKPLISQFEKPEDPKTKKYFHSKPRNASKSVGSYGRS